MAAPAAPAAPQPDALAAGLAQLDELLLLRGNPEVADELAAGFESARQSLSTACAHDATGARCRAALATLDALSGWQALVDGGAAEGPGRVALRDSLLASLTAVAGTLPQTDAVRATILFEDGQPGPAAEVVAAAWSSDARGALGYAPLHAAVRARRDELPDPLRLATPLQADAARAEPAAPATLGYLLLAAGRQRLAVDDLEQAAQLFEQGAAAFAASRNDPLGGEWELATRRADCLVNAGDIHYAAAQQALATGGLPAAMPALRAAEESYSGALDAVPDDAGAIRGVELTADAYLASASGGDGDQAGIRDVFGRLAKRFDRPEWWNNYAFFCRETGQYEESYTAYSRCIELAPDHARWVNDTGLILLYHLDRDLDHAQELFERAWELGKTACDNPFVSNEDRDDNFLAYTDAMLNLAQLHGKRGELDQARTIVDELLTLSPGRSDALALKARLDTAGQKEAPK